MGKNKWICAQKTDVGTVRKVNEDSMFSDSELGIWCVADGMGGHARGDYASGLLTERISSLVSQQKNSLNSAQIIAEIHSVNDELISLSKRLTSVVGTTVAILLIEKQKAHCIWAGDSRIYRLRNHQLSRLTRDHSQVEELVDAGLISASEAENHPKANIITRAVGAHAALELDIVTYDIDFNDKFILCSDGLNKVMPDIELQNFMQYENLANVAKELIELAIIRNARDNVTVVIVENEGFEKQQLGDTLPLDQTLPLRTNL